MTNNNYKITILLSLVALTLTIPLSVQNAFSHGSVDQETSPFNDDTVLSSISDNNLKGQIFIPTVDNLIAVDVGLNDMPLGIGDTIDISIHPGSDPISLLLPGEARTGTVTSIDGETFHLDLDSPVPLVPGETHILELVAPFGEIIGWSGSSTSTYPDGQGIFCNIELNICVDLGNIDHSFRTYFEPPSNNLPVEIDIKPGSDPNSINPRSMGLVPVAILGSDSFDVFDVDVTTLAFGPGGAAPVHEEDGAVPDGHYEDVNDDGFTDLVTHYVQKEALPAAPEACLTGETLDGIPFEGCDSVRTPGKN